MKFKFGDRVICEHECATFVAPTYYTGNSATFGDICLIQYDNRRKGWGPEVVPSFNERVSPNIKNKLAVLGKCTNLWHVSPEELTKGGSHVQVQD